MDFAEYRRCDATELAARVARGEVTPQALLELALSRHHAVHGHINAVVRLTEAQAGDQLNTLTRQAPEQRRPLAGVPFLIKDAHQDLAGVPTGYGSRARCEPVPSVHSHSVRRLLNAGVVIFGKTNTPELALKAVTDPVVHGRCNNPWDLRRTPGGSSGGAAAAVAAGVVPMAAGTDAGGSIRIPAACCGLFGLKPSRGRISAGPSTGEVWGGSSSEGVVSRSVRDSALALDVMAGAEPGDPFTIAPPEAPYTTLMQRAPGRLRIAWSTHSPIGTPVHDEAVAAVHQAADLLRRLGHEVVEGTPEVDGPALAQAYLHLYFAQVPATLARAKALGSRGTDFELLTRLIATLGRAAPTAVLVGHRERWNAFARALGRFHQHHDLLLTPTLAHPPVRHGAGDPPRLQQVVLDGLQRSGLLGLLARTGALRGTIDQIARDSLQYVPFTQLANLTGTPAMSVPLHWTAHGLPLGVQFMAPFGGEGLLLQLAAQLEQAQPWGDRWPRLPGDPVV
jgi:amidase